MDDLLTMWPALHRKRQIDLQPSFHDSNAIEVNTQLAGEYNIENILAALCIEVHFADREKAIHSIESYTPSNSRSQIVSTKTNIFWWMLTTLIPAA